MITKAAEHDTEHDAVLETYRDVENMLRKICWKYMRCRYEGGGSCEFLDRMGTATEIFLRAYLRWDPKQGSSFTTYLYRAVANGLQNECKKCSKNRWIYRDPSKLEWVADYRGQDRYENLSDDARAVVSTILESGEELRALLETTTDKRGIIRAYLAGQGWMMGRITDAFVELQAEL